MKGLPIDEAIAPEVGVGVKIGLEIKVETGDLVAGTTKIVPGGLEAKIGIGDQGVGIEVRGHIVGIDV